MGRLSTHVLDTANGRPAQGVVVDLHELMPDASWRPIKQILTNTDGRTDQPILDADEFRVGTFMLSFCMGDYFRSQGTTLAEPPFLDVIPIRFSVSDENAHYHVPLLASPWAYSTYRGS